MNIVVIGAAKGLGLCLTHQLLELGDNVVAGTVQQSEKLAELQDQFQDRLRIIYADVTDENCMKYVAAQSHKLLGSIDSLCNVAGVLLAGDRVNLINNCDIDDLKKTFAVNAFGPIIVLKSFYPYLSKPSNVFTVTSEGIGVSSCGTWVPCYGLSKMVATKVSGMMNKAVNDISCFSVHPGRMNTDMGRTTAQIEPEESAKGFCRLIHGCTKLNRDNWYIDYLGNSMEM